MLRIFWNERLYKNILWCFKNIFLNIKISKGILLLQPKIFFSFKIIYFRPFLIQKHVYLYTYKETSVLLLCPLTARGGGYYSWHFHSLFLYFLLTCSLREAEKKIFLVNGDLEAETYKKKILGFAGDAGLSGPITKKNLFLFALICTVR